MAEPPAHDLNEAALRKMSAGKPPWWRWFEPPRWFPKWLHVLTCTYCRGLLAYGREVRRG